MEGDVKFNISLADVISKTWKVFSGNFKEILCIILIVYIPVNILLYLSSINVSSFDSLRTHLRILQLLEALIGIIAAMAIIFITAEAINGGKLRVGQALGKAMGRWGPMVITNILMGIILIFLFILFIVPGIIWMVYYTFKDQVVALRGIKNKEALDYTKYIVKGNWWRVIGYSLVITLIPVVIAFPLSLSVSILTNYYAGIEPFEIIINTITDLMLSFTTVGMTVLFLDMEKYRMQNPVDDPSMYEIMNSFVNKGSALSEVSQVYGAPEASEELEGQDGTEGMGNGPDTNKKSEAMFESDLSCPICGIRITPNDTACPLCGSIIKKDEET